MSYQNMLNLFSVAYIDSGLLESPLSTANPNKLNRLRDNNKQTKNAIGIVLASHVCISRQEITQYICGVSNK